MNYAELKIGKLVQTVLKPLIISKASVNEVLLMQDAEWSKTNFGIQYPLLLKTSSTVAEKHYYSDLFVIYGETYRLCCEWFETASNNDRPYVEKWIREHEEVVAQIVNTERVPVGKKKNKGREELEKEANILCSSESLADQKQGAELFLEVQKTEWREPLYPGGMEWIKAVSMSDEVLNAFQNLAIDALSHQRYEEAMKYCEAVRKDAVKFEDEEFRRWSGTSLIFSSMCEYVKKRPGNFAPERRCAEIEVLLCSIPRSPFYDLTEALHRKRRAAMFASVTSIEALGDYYCENATNLEEAKEAYFFYWLLRVDDDPKFAAKLHVAKNKYIDKLSQYVVSTFMNPTTWMPAPPENMTWEEYSGLTEEVQGKLQRTALDDRVSFWNNDKIADSSISDTGAYRPGMIDMEALWKQFVKHPRNQEITKKILCFKKKQYKCHLYLGDFADCCKFLWEKTYKKNS